MRQLLAHLIGDYILQNHTMANLKKQYGLAAAIHAVLYTVPFFFLTTSPIALLVICVTHGVIDHFSLAQYWVRFWGIGQQGWVTQQLGPVLGIPQTVLDRVRAPAPIWLSVWLLFIVDNIMHLVINFLSLRYLGCWEWSQ